MSESPQVNTAFLERETVLLEKVRRIQSHIEAEIETGRADMIFLIARQVHIEKIQNQLRTLKKEKEEADDEESDIPTLFPPAPAEQIRNESY